MSDIQIKQKQDDDLYHKLYAKTTAVQSLLSDTTSNLFGGENKSAEDGLQAIADRVQTKKFIVLKCVDKNGTPISGIVAQGIAASPSTNASGIVYGSVISNDNKVTLSSPFVDITSKTIDASNYIGTIKIHTIQIDTVVENSIVRYTSSATVKFSSLVKSIDICCVGGGGGGAGCSEELSASQGGGGGGGGGIVNSFGISVDSSQSYQIIVAQGGVAGSTGKYSSTITDGGIGGQSKFGSLVAANGGEGGYYARKNYAGGAPGVAGCGTGGTGGFGIDKGNAGTANTTISEFNDGVIFYSGGGGSGGDGLGGKPNGAKGGGDTSATSAGIGGGGGGAFLWVNAQQTLSGVSHGSKGGPGLVVIRIHLKQK